VPLTPPDLISIPALVAAASGLSAAAVAWIVSRALAAVPQENRDYKDAPPLAFRIAWWPIQWMSHFVEPLLSERSLGRWLDSLRKGGLDYSLSPAQFIAARLICSAALAALGEWLLAAFDGSPKMPGRIGTGLHLQVLVVGALLGWVYPVLWLRDRISARKRELLKALPFFLDLITLCVEAGLNLQGAIQQAVAKGPKGVLRDEFQRGLRDIRAGKARAESLRTMASRLNDTSVTNFVAFVIQAETMGMNLGPVLRVQADQRRAERFLRAEKLAMEAPVKMLFPLIAFIFPCTFVVLLFPIAMKFMNAGF